MTDTTILSQSASPSRAFIFPGQGSQSVGMGKDLYDAYPVAKQVFEEVNDALSFKLSDIIFNGPEENLTLTEHVQPALMAVSVAVYRVLEQEGVDMSAAFHAGHSLGEYSALTTAGVLTVFDAAKTLRERGRAMQSAVPVGQGAMAALLGLKMDAVNDLVREYDVDLANDNSDGQVVISGEKAAVEKAAEYAKTIGAKRAVMLNVSAPFHSRLMQPAKERMREVLEDVTFHPAKTKIIPNVTVEATDDVEKLKELLIEQVTAKVRWRETFAYMVENNITHVYELGSGKVLTGLARRIKGLTAIAIGKTEEIKENV